MRRADIVWCLTFVIGVYNVIEAMPTGDWESMSAWLSWLGFFYMIKDRDKSDCGSAKRSRREAAQPQDHRQ